MAALAKISKAEARKAYTQSVLEHIVLFSDFAIAPSESIKGDGYAVQIEDGRAVSCECKDSYYRDPICKHCEATQAKLDASLPLFGTPEMSSLLTDLKKALAPKKIRRSATRENLPALAQDVRVCMKGGKLVVKQPAPVVVEELQRAA